MELELSYESAENIPEGMSNLYTEVDGAFVFTAIPGVGTAAEDLAATKRALANARKVEGKQKKELEAFGEHTPATIQALEHERDELLAKVDTLQGEGDLDEKVATLVEKKLKRTTAPLERQIAELTAERDELNRQVSTLETTINQGKLDDLISGAALKSGVKDPGALEDARSLAARHFEMDEEGNWITRDGVSGIDPGMDAESWLGAVKKMRPLWWAENKPAGSRGGEGSPENGGKNPWSAKDFNLTEQGRIAQTDPELAQRLMASAGTVTPPPETNTIPKQRYAIRE